MRIKVFLLTALLFGILSLSAQESRLAQQYYADGEYEKAGAIFKKLYDSNRQNDFYFNRYVDCLIALEKFDEGEAVLRKQIKKNPKNVQLLVQLGNLYERQFRPADADAQYEKAIKKLSADRFIIIKLANAFTGLTKYELAIKTYERGSELMKDDNLFAYYLGDLYRRKGDNPKMIENYLNSLGQNPSRLNTLKTLFQRQITTEEDFIELQTQLYERAQDEPDSPVYPELLAWVFIQKKDYQNAFRQVKALDRKLEENGARIYQLAQIAADDKAYDAAIQAYDYIVESKGESSSFYIEAKRESLRARRNKLTAGFDYTEEDLRGLERLYESFLEEFGRNRLTATLVAELADLHAFYFNDTDKAIELLKEVIDYPRINQTVQANAKLSLADFYLMKGERWESTLLYSQVDKAFKDDTLGHEARFRNAKLSYFVGDFQWAQTQFDILKASTSKLIANDALDLSIFILDNLGLDTSSAPLKIYADAEMLVFQNKFEEAFSKLNEIPKKFPGNTLEDDVLYLKAGVYYKQRDLVKAAELYQEIVDKHIDGIRGDNSMFKLAELYEDHLNDLEKAKSLYEKLFLDFSGSTFAVEARKRYRKLRGDDL